VGENLCRPSPTCSRFPLDPSAEALNYFRDTPFDFAPGRLFGVVSGACAHTSSAEIDSHARTFALHARSIAQLRADAGFRMATFQQGNAVKAITSVTFRLWKTAANIA